MKCRHCGLPIRAAQPLYLHEDGWSVCDLDRSHPMFMLLSAEPEEE